MVERSGLRDAAATGASPPAHAQSDEPGHRGSWSSPSPSPTPDSDPAASAPRLAQERWGGIVSATTRSGASCVATASRGGSARLSLVAGYVAPAGDLHGHPNPSATSRSTIRASSWASTASTWAGCQARAGKVWQYTAIDLATSYVWAELHTTPLNPSATQHQPARPARGRRPRVRAAGASSGRLRIMAREFRSSDVRGRAARSVGAVQTRHPPGPAHLQRLGRAGPAHDPRGVLATIVREEPRAQARWARAGPRGLSGLLQHRESPYRTSHPQGRTPWQTLDRSEQDEAEMTTLMCRYISVAVHSVPGSLFAGGLRTALAKIWSGGLTQVKGLAPSFHWQVKRRSWR